MNSFFLSTKGKFFPNDAFKASLRTTSTTTTTKKKQDIESKIKTPNPKTESKIKLPKSQTPKSIKIQDPKSKLQNRDQKASKRVCPTRVCLTSVSARPSAQQLRPHRLKHLKPPLTIHFDVLFAQFFLVIRAAVLYMEFWFMTGFPQESRQFFVFCKFTSTVSKMSSWKSPKKCAKFGS